MPTLIIYLPLQAAVAGTEFDFAITADGVGIEASGRATADALPSMPDAERVAVAPARALSWHRVTLPEGMGSNANRLRAVLEGLLEDQLLDEPSRLHFAWPPKLPAKLPAGEPQWVAACDRRWLAMAYQALEAAGRQVSRVVPEWGPPGHSLRLHASGALDDPQLLVCGPTGVSQMPLAGVTLAALSGSSLADADASLPDSVLSEAHTPPSVSAEPALVDLTSHALGCPVLPLTREERWLRAISSPWDLSLRLQMRKRAQRARLEWLRAPRWRLARWAAVAVVGLNLVGLNALAWVERAEQSRQHEWMAQTLRRNFAQAQAVPSGGDVPAYMARQVQQLAQATAVPQSDDLDVMLGVLTQSLPAGQSLRSVQWSPGQLRVSGLSLPPELSQSLSSALQARGYSWRVDIQGAVMQPLKNVSGGSPRPSLSGQAAAGTAGAKRP